MLSHENCLLTLCLVFQQNNFFQIIQDFVKLTSLQTNIDQRDVPTFQGNRKTFFLVFQPSQRKEHSKAIYHQQHNQNKLFLQSENPSEERRNLFLQHKINSVTSATHAPKQCSYCESMFQKLKNVFHRKKYNTTNWFTHISTFNEHK